MYVTNPDSKTPIFQINQHIGDDKDVVDDEGKVISEGDGMGIDGRVFADEVLSYNDSDVDKLIFYTNSQGGDVQKSLDMFNAISMSKRKTHAIITGFAFSCAGWIPMAADKVSMVRETGRWMCHMPYNPENPEEKSQFMDEVVDIIAGTISAKSGRNGKVRKTKEEIKKLMREKTYWDAERMYKEGLIDEIVEASGKVIRMVNDPITLNKTELNFFYKEYQVAQNKFVAEETKIIQPKKNNKMAYEKIVNRLKQIDKKALGFSVSLSDDANEDAIMDVIVRLDNRLRAMNDDMMDKEEEGKKIILDSKKLGEDLKNKMDEKEKEAAELKKKANNSECEYNKLKEAHDKMELENKSMKEEKEKADNLAKENDLKARKDRAINYVDKLVAQGTVAATPNMTLDAVKEHLVNKGVNNYDDLLISFPMKNIKFSAAKPHIFKNGDAVSVNLIDKMVADNKERIMKKQYVTDGGVINTENAFAKKN